MAAKWLAGELQRPPFGHEDGGQIARLVASMVTCSRFFPPFTLPACSYVASMGPADAEEYLLDVFGGDKKASVAALVRGMVSHGGKLAATKQSDAKVYRKPAAPEFVPGSSHKPVTSDPLGAVPSTSEQTKGSGKRAKSKPEFVPLLSREGQQMISLLPGRHPCACLATKHELINNCTECGKIVCAQEGAGPCLFCGALVCSPEDMAVLARNSKKSVKLREKLLREGGSLADASLERAMQQKQRLLEFDRTAATRMRVIDDEMDYYAHDANRWLSDEEKEALRCKEEALREQRHQSRKERKVLLDFAGRRVLEDADVNSNGACMYDHDFHTGDSKPALNVLYADNDPEEARRKLLALSDRLKATNSNPKQDEIVSSVGIRRAPLHRLQLEELDIMSDSGAFLVL